jgi:glutamate---cysteine ligase / carboxylate-amine ligase
MAADAGYSTGIEEEYFLFNADTRHAIVHRDEAFIARATARLGARVTTEMLQSQIEAITPPCTSIAAARAHLVECRQVLGEEAGASGLGIAATGTFPLAYWRGQLVTPKERYDAIMDDLQMLGLRNMLCGMHVHVSLPDASRRVLVMQRVVTWLPLLLALSTSSPFWEGHPSGLHGYRPAAYDELPRTGLPELLRTTEEYEEFVGALVSTGIIPDASHIWWSLRPSAKHPTLELRITDVCTRIDDAMAIAALFRCLVRAADREQGNEIRLNRIGRAITAENKWRAQRHGVHAVFVDPTTHGAMSVGDCLDMLRHALADDIDALDCGAEFARLAVIAETGSSADHQMRIYQAALGEQGNAVAALEAVVNWAAAETLRTECRSKA